MKEDDYFYYDDLPDNKEESLHKLYNYLEFVGFKLYHKKPKSNLDFPITLYKTYLNNGGFVLGTTFHNAPALKKRITKEELEKLCKLGELYESR